MCRRFLFFLLVSIACSDVNAQKGANTISINGEATIPYFQNDRGFGFFLKGLYGIGASGQLSFSAGVSEFNSKNKIEAGKVTTRLVPFLFGYKQNIGKFFMEPKIGIGELGGRILKNADYSRPSVAAMFGGLAAGYTLRRLHFGINFLTAHGIENTSAGAWYNKNFHYTSIFAGYDLFANSKD